MESLRAQGKSYREIGAEMGLSGARVCAVMADWGVKIDIAPRTCAVCGAVYDCVIGSRQKYCSEECRGEAMVVGSGRRVPPECSTLDVLVVCKKPLKVTALANKLQSDKNTAKEVAENLSEPGFLKKTNGTYITTGRGLALLSRRA